MKKIINTQKLAICTTAIALSIGSVFGAYCFSNNQKSSKADTTSTSYEEMLPAIEKVSKECAKSLAEKTEPDLNLEVKDVIPIYNVTDNIVGYSVSYFDGDTPYGYASFDFTTEELITDFVIHENTESMYNVLTESFTEADTSVEINECTDKLYATTGVDYAVSAKQNNKETFYYNASTYNEDDFENMLDYYEDNYLEFYDNTEYEDNFYSELADSNPEDDYIVQGKITDWFKKWLKKLFPSFFDEDYIAPTAYPNHSEVFKEIDKLVGEVSDPIMLPQYSKEKSLTSQETIMKTTSRYACGLVALTSICNQEDILVNGNIQDTFNKLWDLTGTQANIYETSEFYGKQVDCSGTTIYNMAAGMRYYGSELGINIQASTKARPQFATFKSAVDNHNSSVLCYQIANEGGHGVSIVGYANGNIAEHNIDYLLAADGWYDDIPRYVLYNPALFESCTAITYTINK